MIPAHASQERIPRCVHPAISIRIRDPQMVNLPKESTPYLPYIKRINLSFSFNSFTFLNSTYNIYLIIRRGCGKSINIVLKFLKILNEGSDGTQTDVVR